MANHLNKLINTVGRTKSRVIQQSKQRRGGVTDLYALDYVSSLSTSTGCAPVSDDSLEGSESDNLETRIKTLVRAIKKEIPDATPEGVAGIVGYFGRESNVTARRYEADYLTDNQFDKMVQEPTAENLLGSWGAFAGLYSYPLNEPGYNVGGKHWIGLGLGQWTGPRAKALYEFAKGRNSNLFTFNTQVAFMMTEEGLKNVVKEVATSKLDVAQNTTRFLADWGRVPGNALQERIDFANKYFDLIKTTLESKSTDEDSEKSKSDSDTVVINKGQSSAKFRVLVPSDLDRFQRWFLKFIIEMDKSPCEDGKVIPLTDVHLVVSASNQATGETSEIELTEIFRRQWGCNWIGDDASGEGIFPNNNAMEGYDLMYSAWYLNDTQRSALFSPGEKIFTVYALGEAKITLRNFLKFSHIN
nr:MAG TPA: structural protein [Caudoviricetes sp.]